MKFMTLVAFFVSGLASVPVMARDPASIPDSTQVAGYGSGTAWCGDPPCLTPAERARLDVLGASVRSASDLRIYLATTPRDLSPLEKLSPGAKRRFLASLFFNENGLVSYDYSDLAKELSASDIYRVLSLFGAQRTVPLIRGLRIETATDELPALQPYRRVIDDHEAYRCIGGHSCIHNPGMICMTGC